MSETAQTFGKRLRELRSRRDWSQAELAARVTKLGVQMERTAVARIESGGRKTSIEEAVAFAAALDVPLLALLLGEHFRGVRGSTALAWMSGKTPLTVEGAKSYRDAAEELRASELDFWAGIHPRTGRVPSEVTRAFIEKERLDIEDLARFADRPAMAEEIQTKQQRLDVIEGSLE